MIELPEAYVLAQQINETLAGKKIMNVTAAHTPHKFAWYHGDPQKYHGLLNSKTIDKAVSYGGLINTLTETEKKVLFDSIIGTLTEMASKGGRDTERDLFGCFGGYKIKAGRNTVDKPCRKCGSNIINEAYMGGSIYYCPECQKK